MDNAAVSVADLPLVNACLNGITTVLLVAGYVQIKGGHQRRHGILMGAAFITSSLFLLFYVLHKIAVKGVHTKLGAEGAVLWLYYAMLASHIILAMVNLPMILRVIYLSLAGRYAEHKRLARWTFPIWMYVSVTGVLVYLFLYQWFPQR